MRIGKDAKTELLKSVPLFSGCTKQELQKLAMIADEIDLRDGSALTREGQPGREFFVLVEGTVDVIQGDERVSQLGAGDWFGEIALLTNAPRTATVTATSPVRVLVVTDRAFKQVVSDADDRVKMLERVGERLATTLGGATTRRRCAGSPRGGVSVAPIPRYRAASLPRDDRAVAPDEAVQPGAPRRQTSAVSPSSARASAKKSESGLTRYSGPSASVRSPSEVSSAT